MQGYFQFYESLNDRYKEELSEIGIGIINDCLTNKEHIIEFQQRYIQGNKPKIVICGINPGRFGAGKTGVPFLDFKSLSRLLPNIQAKDSEKSSQFFYSIIEEFGADTFYKNFYVTNLSWFGFYDLRTSQNINYNRLPQHIQEFILDNFAEEMTVVDPKIIIPLGDIVNWELTLNLKKKGRINAEIGKRLYHPSFLKASKEDYMKSLRHYLQVVG